MRARRAAGALLLSSLVASCATAPPPRVLPPVTPVEVVDPFPRRDVLALAMQSYRCAEREGRLDRPGVLTVIDYSLPSSEPRLWVIDVDRNQVLHHELVAHGEGSGGAMAVSFSNEAESHKSSLGLFRTEEVYTGRFGYSLRLSGLEPGINDKARERAIVMHGSPEVSASVAAQSGMIGRSWGCPTLPQDVAPQVINRIAGGSAIFAYYPDTQWLQQSHYLHCGVQLAGVVAGR